MRRFLDPKNDLTFKRLFGTEKNKGILLAFLNDIFDGVHPKIEDVSFQPLNKYPEIKTFTQGIVDLSCRDIEGNQLIIEMQCYGDSEFLQRACFYTSCVYIGQKTQGKKYDELKPVRFLAILERSLFSDDADYLSHDKILNIRTHQCRLKQFSFSFFELSKINKNFEDSRTAIEKWAYFFKNATEITDKELEAIANDRSPVKDAYYALEQYNYTKEELETYNYYDRNASAITTSLSDAKAEGKAEGLAEGRAEGLAEGKAEGLAEGLTKGLAEGEAKGIAETKREMVVEMHHKGIDKNVIVEISHLALEEVEQIISRYDEKNK
jgi:predicted transposase/invertase (TIGR01784 family)